MSEIKVSNYIGERLSFYQLFQKMNLQVEIPIIQRDYAQGRTSEVEVRTTFLQALHDYLKQNTPFRDLDFVYGSVKVNPIGRDRFIPLDGQQRLTTLFLLHWYLAQISGKGDLFRKVLSPDGMSLFTYETRSSSREFCNALVANDIDFSSLLYVSGLESVTETIRDQSWFFLSWASDPTICAMLTMLDAIHDEFNGCISYFDKLVDLDKPIITFRFLNLAEFDLTDDLYIKMNARGKPLTVFETFKAKLEQVIKAFSGPWPSTYKLSFKDEHVCGHEYFIHKVDTDWSDLFWPYRNELTNDNTFDDELMNLIRFVIAYNYTLECKQANQLFGPGGTLVKFGFAKYQELGCLNQGTVVDLISVLDLLHEDGVKNGTISRYLADNTHYDEESTFKQVIKNQSSYKAKLRFFALYRYLSSHQNNEFLPDWMRVIFNLTENTIINTQDDFVRALLSVNDMLLLDKPILETLRKDCRILMFSMSQVLEEKVKSHLMLRSAEWRSAILSLEKHPFFRGQIGFALSFAGIIDYYSANSDCGWDNANDLVFYERFKKYSLAGSSVFSSIQFSSSALNYAWERAMLSKGQYFTDWSAERFNLLSSRVSKNNIERDHSWRRLLVLSTVLDSGCPWKYKQSLVKAVFDDEHFDPSDLKNSLEKICGTALQNEQIEPWRKLFIGYPQLFEYCNQGVIAISGSEIVLLSESQRNHYHSELFTKALSLKLITELPSSKFSIRYFEVKSREESPSLRVSESDCSLYIKQMQGNFRFEFILKNADPRSTLLIKLLAKHHFKYIENELDDIAGMGKYSCVVEPDLEIATQKLKAFFDDTVGLSND